MEELLAMLNGLEIVQKSFEFENDLPEEIVDKYFKNRIASDLLPDRRRWYETSISVFKTDKGFLGVRSLTSLHSESSDVEDCYHKLKFYDMVEKSIITYALK